MRGLRVKNLTEIKSPKRSWDFFYRQYWQLLIVHY